MTLKLIVSSEANVKSVSDAETACKPNIDDVKLGYKPNAGSVPGVLLGSIISASIVIAAPVTEAVGMPGI